MTSPIAATRRPPVRRPPASAGSHRSGAGRSQASLGPLQLELFGGGRPMEPRRSSRPLPPQSRQAGRTFDPRHQPALTSRPPQSGRPPATPAPEAAQAELFRRLSRLTGGRLRSLWLTDNRRTILSVRPADPAGAHPSGPGGRRRAVPGTAASRAARAGARRPRPARGRTQQDGVGPALDLRIHRSFAIAPEPVLRAVAAFLWSSKGSPSARRALVAIREHFHHHRPDPRTLPPAGQAKTRHLSLCPVGGVLDLRQIAGDLNQRYFDGRLHRVRITWGKATGESSQPASRCRRATTTSLQLGSYSYEDRLIRIHRVLDRADVPRYVVESVVYHELLHADLPPVTRNGRRYFHTPEFRRRERHFRQFERADCWVRDNLHQLLRARRDARAGAAGAGLRRR
jgi:hypothetical protein